MSQKLLRALIIEDSEDDALLLQRQLRSGGYELIARQVDTAEAMKAALEEETWDIIFADYTMPRFDGLAALHLQRANNADIPFIFVSGTIGEDTAVMARRAGAQDYIMKGRNKRLLPAVERELHEAEARRERRRTEQDHARLVATLETTTDFVATTNAQGMLLNLIGAGRTMLGIDATDDFTQVSLFQLSPAWSANFLRDALSIAHRDGVWSGECTLLARNGTEILVSHLIQAHHDAIGAVEFYSSIARYISERKRFV